MAAGTHRLQGLRAWSVRHRFLLVFGLLAVLMGCSVGVAKVAATLHGLALGASVTQLGLLSAGQVVGTLAMSVPVGFLVDRHGPRRLFVLGSLLAGAIYALVPLGDSPAFLMGCLTAVSFCMPLRFVSLNAVFFAQIQQLGEGKAGWYRATHMSGMFLIGPALGVLLIDAFGPAPTWWLIAASFALTVAVCPIVFGRYAEPARGGPRPGWRALFQSLGPLLRDREMRETARIDVVIALATAYHTTFIVPLALQGFGLDAPAASVLLSANGICFILALFFTGHLLERLGRRRTGRLGLGLAVLALLIEGLAPRAGWLLAGAMLEGLALGLLQTLSLGRVARLGARLGPGRVSGLNLLVHPVGALAGSVLGGLVAEQIGLQAVFLLLVLPFLLLAARPGGPAGVAEAA